MTETLNNIGAIITLLFGIWAFVQPVKFSKLISLTPYKKKGITEIRSTYGGLIMGLGSYALWSQSVTAFHCLAIAWFATAIARSIGTLLDGSYYSMTLLFLGIEVGTGILLLV